MDAELASIARNILSDIDTMTEERTSQSHEIMLLKRQIEEQKMSSERFAREHALACAKICWQTDTIKNKEAQIKELHNTTKETLQKMESLVAENISLKGKSTDTGEIKRLLQTVAGRLGV
jgi:small-conductance mechanosensitive channel